MGGASARITSADFLTPPELRAYRLAAAGAGRIGGVRAELLPRTGGTRLGACYQQVPLRVVPAFDFGPGGPALVYLLNPTAGLMDGDGQLVRLHAHAGASALVVGQSATRIHPALRSFCTQQWHIHVEAGAVLAVLPGPAIPFAGCRYYQHVAVSLARGAGFVWGDVWLAGRYARGTASEQFQFETLVQELTVRREGRLVFRDRFCWDGPWDRQTADWHCAGAAACAGLFRTGPFEADFFQAAPVLARAVFTTAAGDSFCRWHGPGEAVIAGVVEAALRSAARLKDGPGAGPWLWGGHDLGPNHWFSPPADRRP